MDMIEERRLRLRRHFGDRPVVWVPFWGISKLRQRGCVLAGEIPGDMIEYDKWYERMLSPETFDRLAELGFNLAILPFSLGGTAEQEAQEHEDFRRAAALCHERRIVALPYLQYQNLLQESWAQDFDTWAVQPDGKVSSYVYFRRTICQDSSEFRNYFNGLIGEAARCGADGLWIDNTFLKPCVCADCRRRFAEYFVEKYPDLVEKFHLIPEKIEIAPLDISPSASARTLDSCRDPVIRAFFEFNMHRNLELLKGFRDEMRKSNPDGLFASNPSIHRGRPTSLRGVDQALIYEIHDIIYQENTLLSCSDRGIPQGNFRGVTEADAFGAVAVTGAWKHRPKPPRSGMPEPEEIGPMLLEPLLYGGGASAFWMIREMPDVLCRSGDDKLKGYWEYPPMFEAMKRTLAGLRGLPRETFNTATTGVWFDRDSWNFDYYVFEESRYAVTEALVNANIPWRSVTTVEAARELELLILPSPRLMSDATVAELRKLADSGVKILVIGADSALFDERFRRRSESPLAVLAGSSRYAKASESSCGNWHLLGDDGVRGEAMPYLTAPEGYMRRPGYLLSGTLIEKIRSLNPPEFTVEGGVTATLRRAADGHEFMQLLDYRTPVESRDVVIRFGRERAGGWRTPAGEWREFRAAELAIPGFRSYGIVELTE